MTIFTHSLISSLRWKVKERTRRKARKKMRYALRIACDAWKDERLELTADAYPAIGIMAAEIFREIR